MSKCRKYMSNIGNGRWVWDFHKIDRSGFPIVILISERGQTGKTFSFKEFALDQWRKKKHKSSFSKVTETLLDKEKPKLLKNHKLQFPDKWEGVTRTGNKLYDAGEAFMELVALSTSEAEKGSRDASIKYLFLDEYNVGQCPNKSFLLDNLLATYTSAYGEGVHNPLKLFIAGNNKSLADPILFNMGIYIIEQEVTMFHTDGEPLILVLCPVKTEEQVEKLNSNNWVYKKAKISGTAEHMFHNSSAFDNVNGVISNMKNNIVPRNKRHIARYTISGEQFDLFNVQGGDKAGMWWTQALTSAQFKAIRCLKSVGAVAGSKKDAENGLVVLPSGSKLYLGTQITKGRVFYDSMYTKKAVISLL